MSLDLIPIDYLRWFLKAEIKMSQGFRSAILDRLGMNPPKEQHHEHLISTRIPDLEANTASATRQADAEARTCQNYNQGTADSTRDTVALSRPRALPDPPW